MITFGFNTLAMLTYGLGIRMPWVHMEVIRRPIKIEFRDKPPGIAVEEKTGPASFEEGTFEVEDREVKFKDR